MMVKSGLPHGGENMDWSNSGILLSFLSISEKRSRGVCHISHGFNIVLNITSWLGLIISGRILFKILTWVGEFINVLDIVCILVLSRLSIH